MGLLDSFEHRGWWWLPDRPADKVAGVLAFSQDRVSLELIGQLPREQQAPDPVTGDITHAFMPLSRARILGETTRGKLVTLEECHATSLAIVGGQHEHFAPGFVLEGAHFDADELIVFDEFAVRYSQLDIWVAVNGFETQSIQTDGESLQRIDVSFSPPPEERVSLEGFDIAVGFSVNFHASGPTRTQVELTQRAHFRFYFHQRTPLTTALDTAHHLRNFVALGVGQPVIPTELTGYVLSEPDVQATEGPGPEPRKHSVRIYYRLAQSPTDKERHPAKMLFTLTDAQNRLQGILTSWFSKRDALEPVFDLYFGAVYNRRSFIEQRFLSLMQALETYHRRTTTTTDLPPEEHSDRINSILADTPQEFRRWLTAKLTYSNELALRQRLRDVLAGCPAVVGKLTSNKRAFVSRAVDSRNFLTHFDPQLKARATTGIDLQPMVVTLQALVELCLLRELGFDCDEIDGFFQRVGRYRRE